MGKSTYKNVFRGLILVLSLDIVVGYGKKGQSRVWMVHTLKTCRVCRWAIGGLLGAGVCLAGSAGHLSWHLRWPWPSRRSMVTTRGLAQAATQEIKTGSVRPLWRYSRPGERRGF